MVFWLLKRFKSFIVQVTLGMYSYTGWFAFVQKIKNEFNRHSKIWPHLFYYNCFHVRILVAIKSCNSKQKCKCWNCFVKLIKCLSTQLICRSNLKWSTKLKYLHKLLHHKVLNIMWNLILVKHVQTMHKFTSVQTGLPYSRLYYHTMRFSIKSNHFVFICTCTMSCGEIL